MNEVNFTPEIEAVKPHEVICLYDLSPDQQRELTEAIEKSNGRIRIFVHPFFESILMNNDAAEEIDRATMKLIRKSSSDKSVPVFFLESAASANLTIDLFSEMLKDEPQSFTNIYYAVTHPYSPTPCKELRPGNFGMSSSLDEGVSEDFTLSVNDNGRQAQLDNRTICRQEDKRWKEFSNQLRKMGVTEIIVGGQSLTIERADKPDVPDLEVFDLPDGTTDQDAAIFFGDRYSAHWMQELRKKTSEQRHYLKQRDEAGAKNTDYFLAKCVGTAIQHLAKDFKIIPSNLSYPENRSDILRIENEE